jgi:hypothetical protein
LGRPGHHPLKLIPHGGQLGEAYIHGMNGIAEAVRQVRASSVNQIPGDGPVLVTALSRTVPADSRPVSLRLRSGRPGMCARSAAAGWPVTLVPAESPIYGPRLTC